MLFRKLIPAVIVLAIGLPTAASAALPDFTDIVEDAKDSVVNISTRNNRSENTRRYQLPELPEGTPFGELIEKFLDPEEFGPSAYTPHQLGRKLYVQGKATP